MALHTVITGCNPVWDEIGFAHIACRLFRMLEDEFPQIFAVPPVFERCITMSDGNVASNRMSLVPMNTAFPLLEVNRVAREIPMDYTMTPRMKVEPFLADRGWL